VSAVSLESKIKKETYQGRGRDTSGGNPRPTRERGKFKGETGDIISCSREGEVELGGVGRLGHRKKRKAVER